MMRWSYGIREVSWASKAGSRKREGEKEEGHLRRKK